ncbi:hypothetical protein [Nonomuraea africana]|uniref:DNA-binding beta-propeller fold protein YncE n=1 Tax=Nonomuraea africana TaxID=46171 RepID=A0ABR9KQW7_9ACTN|nr:hypothetical protein [Nonomuraea africana]MBE1563922.1 DNA-binding beta-propeller fold protein YncE [Nonomuraea africana]
MAVGLVVAQAPAALAVDTMTDLGVTWGGADIAVGGGKVFVSANDRIVVTDAQGALKDAITGLPRPSGLAVTADGTLLYVALSGSHQVAEIDTQSLEISRRIDLTAYPCPQSLTLAGSRLWVGHGCSDDWKAGVVSLDVSATVPEPSRIPITLYKAPLVVAAGNALVVGETGVSPADLLVYDVSSTTATLRGVIDGSTYGLNNLQDLSITPDGSMVVSAFGSPHRFEGWDTTSLTRVRTYGGEPTWQAGATAVAVSPDGARVVGGWSHPTSEAKRIALYDVATTARTYTNDNSIGELVAGSLVFSGNDIFGVIRQRYTDRLHLWRMEGTTLPASTLALTAPSTAQVLEPLTLTGRLALGGSDAGAQPIVVTRRLPDGTIATLAGVTTEADGTFTVTDTPPVQGTIRYDVIWDGNSEFRWSMASATVRVVKRESSLTLTAPFEVPALESLTMTGRLALTDGSAPGAQPLVAIRYLPNGTSQTLPTVTTKTDGTFTITDIPPVSGDVRYDVHWEGNAMFWGSTASRTVLVAKRDLSLTLSGPTTGIAGKELQFSGTLDAGGQLPASGLLIKVLRTVTNRNGTDTTTLPSVAFASDGSFTFADTPSEGGEHTYTVRWTGDWASLPAEASRQITIRGGVG